MYRFAMKAIPSVVMLVAGVFTPGVVMALDPANIELGPLYLTPTLAVKEYYTDNLWLTNVQEKDTWASVVTPKVQAWMQNGPSDYSMSFQVEDSTYHSSGDDDYTDYTTHLDIHQEFTARNSANLFAYYYDGHERRGTGFIEGELSLITNKPVEYTQATFGGDYTYGSTEGRGRMKLAAKSSEFDYKNFREFTRYYDRTEDTLDGTFYWKVASRTDALFELRAIDNNYDRPDPEDPAGTLTNDEWNYLVGVAWDATAKSSGHVKVGGYDRQYDSSDRSDEEGFLWEVGVEWKPRSYSLVDFTTRRYYQATNGLGDGINTREAKLGWRHGWSERSSTRLNLGFSNDDYEGSERKDDIYGVEARYDYAFRRWADFGIGYRYEDCDSDLDFYDYNENVFFVEAKLSL
jgi:hypothetical protein